MNTCKECKMGYCPNRVKRVFGFVQRGYCSPQCFTASIMGTAKPSAKKLASEIIDLLLEEGAIGEHIAENPDRFAELVEKIEPLLKPV